MTERTDHVNSVSPQVDVDHLRSAVTVAAAVSSLPAIATQDWCARAAGALRAIRPHAVVAVTLAVLGPRGSILQLEATGAVGSDPLGRPLEGQTVHPEHIPSLEWWIDGELAPPSDIAVAAITNLNCYSRWVDSAAGRRWARLAVDNLLVGIAPMPGNTAGRCLAVEIGAAGPAPATFGEIEVLRASLALLARRALLAFGLQRSTPMSRLTYREQQVLDHLALGKSVKEIAQDLARSPHTVHDHVKSLHRKLNASSRGELIARALGHSAAESHHVPEVGTNGHAVVMQNQTLLSA